MGNEGVVEWRVRCNKGCTSGSGFETGVGGVRGWVWRSRFTVWYTGARVPRAV